MKKKRKLKKQGILIICGIVVLLIILFVVLFLNRKSQIYQKNIIGSWTIDNVTIYEFNKNNKGKLKVSLDEYLFTYQIKSDEIVIDFDNSDEIVIDFDNNDLQDSEYTFVIEKNKLILSGTNGVFEFSKVK